MEIKKNITQAHFLFNKGNARNLIIVVLIILLGGLMASRKQFILDPYENFIDLPQVYTSTTPHNTHGNVHPLYADGNYIPAALKIVPSQFLFRPWFHITSAIIFWTLTIGGVYILIKMGGFTSYQSIAMTLFSLFCGNLITKELFDIPLLAPAPYVGYQYYSVRIPVIPLSIFGLIALLKRRFVTAGILIGLATYFHIKFGFRFFALTLFSLLLWKFLGSRKAGFQENNITARNLILFVISWGILSVITYFEIKASMGFFDSLNLPQSQPLASSLAWLIRNEADDYLVSYHFSLARPFWGYLFMAIASVIFCECIVKLSKAKPLKIFAIVWEMAILIAMAFWGFGFLFESYLIDSIPLSLARIISIFRVWDLLWVVVIGFWITLFLVLTTISQRILIKIGKPDSISENFIFHFAIIIFISLNVAIFVKFKESEVVKTSSFRNGKLTTMKGMKHVQICNKITPEYNNIYWQAVNAIQERDEKLFQESIFRLNTIYDKFKGNLENPSLQNLDSIRLNSLNHFVHGRYSKGIVETIKLRNAEEKDIYWWSCHHSESGVHSRLLSISSEDYMNAVDWIKLNLPSDKAIIQPPYLGKFTTLSKHIGFWDAKSDQHMMYSIEGYYKLGLHRLRSIAGPHAMETESGIKSHGLGPMSRWHFLDLTREDIINIQRDYPGYEYLLTENKNLRGYPAIYSNPTLTLFDISKP